MLKLIATDFVSSNRSSTPPIGAGGADRWKFQAVGAGKTQFKLGYFPPSNPNQDANEFTPSVSVI